MNDTTCACEENVTMIPIRGLGVAVDSGFLNDETLIRKIVREELARGGIFPDLQFDRETVWPVQREGKQVYAMLKDCGTMPNASVGIFQHGIENVDWISIAWEHSRIGYEEGFNLGVCNMNPNAAFNSSLIATVSRTEVRKYAGGDRRTLRVILCLLYTKLSEPSGD